MGLKKFLIIFIVILPGLVNIPITRALYNDEITLSFSWSDTEYYQGDDGTVRITVRSTCNNEIRIKWIGIHFEWQRLNYYYLREYSYLPKRLLHGDSYTSTIEFDVDADASVGWNIYHVHIVCDESHWYGTGEESWTSDSSMIFIHDVYEGMYQEIVHTIIDEVESAGDLDFECPDAISSLSKASNKLGSATSLANQDLWQNAYDHITDARNYITEAASYEKTYWDNNAQDAIEDAQEKIESSSNLFSPEAKSLFTEASNSLESAEAHYGQGTIEHFKIAYEDSQDVLSIIDEARSKENQFLLYIGCGAAVIILVLAIIFAKRR